MTLAADLLRALPVSGKGLALLGSVSMHAAVALVVVRGAPHAARNANVLADAIVEVTALELSVAEAPAQPVPALASASAHHHHDYPVPPDHDAAAHDPLVHHLLPLQRASSLVPVTTPAVIDSPAPAVARFVMTVAPATHVAGESRAEVGDAKADERVRPEPTPEASVEIPARLLAGSSPSYTREAEAAGVEADVPLEIIVDGAGSVIGARTLSHVGYGLDQAALASVRAYRFSPARRAGKTVPVRMRWLVRFQLR